MSDGDAHTLVEVLRDDLGVIMWCSCGRWGYAGPDEESARAAHRIHLDESGRADQGDGG